MSCRISFSLSYRRTNFSLSYIFNRNETHPNQLTQRKVLMMTLQSTFQNPTSLLRRTLRANALSSGISGLAFMVAAKPIALFLGLDAPFVLIAIGAGLLLYALALWFNAGRQLIDRQFVWVAIIGDTAWVVGSFIILLTDWLPLTPAGWWTVAIIADVVAIFAVVQFYGLRQISKR